MSKKQSNIGKCILPDLDHYDPQNTAKLSNTIFIIENQSLMNSTNTNQQPQHAVKYPHIDFEIIDNPVDNVVVVYDVADKPVVQYIEKDDLKPVKEFMKKASPIVNKTFEVVKSIIKNVIVLVVYTTGITIKYIVLLMLAIAESVVEGLVSSLRYRSSQYVDFDNEESNKSVNIENNIFVKSDSKVNIKNNIHVN